MKFAPEGIPFIAVALIVSAVAAFFTFTANRHIVFYLVLMLFCIDITAFMFYFFRDPERVIPQGENIIVSPADGKVIVVSEVFENTVLNDNVRKLSIFMSPLNVHVNRIPYTGTVVNVKRNAGNFFKAFMDEASLTNENVTTTVETDRGTMLIKQIAGSVARRAVCRAAPGDRLLTGDRFGIIKFSSRVDLFLPLSAQIIVKTGDMVRAGETIVATWTQEKER
ncbi:phosphatidylserine decarboxylase family protein [Candidatus Magnetomonas plexicatena]|uniref:phosphatidylserine decarboxylase family protein n=1 Tax=Candidatus Magnetomonas plexicatena TaxID=2552947 RepID=UPI001102EC1E|nr:phosphatidylserine decarboxylase family protein [Nitrospirales bacterium LBB_01]